jgi:hypothetical protein
VETQALVKLESVHPARWDASWGGHDKYYQVPQHRYQGPVPPSPAYYKTRIADNPTITKAALTPRWFAPLGYEDEDEEPLYDLHVSINHKLGSHI